MIRAPGRYSPPRNFLTLVAAMLIASATVLTSCQSPKPQGGMPPMPRVTAIQEEPQVRVRVVSGAPSITLAGPSLTLAAPGSPGYAFAAPVQVRREGTAFIITDSRGQSVRWPAVTLETTAGGEGVVIAGNAYPGTVVLQAVGEKIDAVNHVPIEQYLPGVLERELYSSWPPETFVAQAIAARSYAIALLPGTGARHYDLESTTASQVYGGRASNPKAIDAVQRTRGQVLAWNGRVVTAFFSASSGGVSQDASAAFPDKRPGVDIPPLRGRPHGWGRSSPNFQWGPLRRDLASLSRRIAAWGQAKRHPVASLALITRIDVVQQSGAGRPAVFQVTDARGQVYRLPAESFRFACNADAPGLPKLESAQQLKSSYLDVQLGGGVATFTGRGHGHGVGLDQWAARDMATQGYTGQQIASFFYPGAQIQRLY